MEAFYGACRVATCPSKPRRSWKLYAGLTPPLLRRTLEAMPAGFDAVSCVRVKAFYAAKGKELVADFWANEKFHLSPAYSDESRAGQEQEARRDFIDKFWLALGWDVNQIKKFIEKAAEFSVEA